MATFLNEDEQAAVQRVHDTYQHQLSDWIANHGALVAEAKTDFGKFLESQDRMVREKIRDPERRRKVRAAVLLEKQIQQAYEAGLVEAIPGEKFSLWQQNKIGRTVISVMASLQLTKDQVEQIGGLASSALKRATNPKHWHSEAAAELERLVERQVLTPGQRKEFEAIKKRNQFRYMSWNG